MESLLSLVIILFFGVTVPLLIFRMFRERDSRAPLEAGKKAIFEEKCGGRFDFWNCSKPLVRHSIYDHFVVFSYMGHTHILPFEDITEVSRVRGVTSMGLRYYHLSKAVPKKVTIWTDQTDRILSLIKEKICQNSFNKAKQAGTP